MIPRIVRNYIQILFLCTCCFMLGLIASTSYYKLTVDQLTSQIQQHEHLCPQCPEEILPLPPGVILEDIILDKDTE